MGLGYLYKRIKNTRTCSVAQLWQTLQLHGLLHPRLRCPSPAPRACSNSCSLSLWCHPTIFSSVVPFSSCLPSFPALGSFLISQLFASGVQSIGASALATVLPVNIQDWFPLGLTGLLFFAVQGTLHLRTLQFLKYLNKINPKYIYITNPMAFQLTGLSACFITIAVGV